MPRRTLVVFATFFISLLLYIDRTCIQVAGDGIKADLGLTDTQFGWILSIFTLGYALAQTPSGIIADRAGPRNAGTRGSGEYSCGRCPDPTAADTD